MSPVESTIWWIGPSWARLGGGSLTIRFRRERVVWSGALRSRPIKLSRESRKPSVWRSGRPKTTRRVEAVERLLNDEEWAKWSDSEIARRAAVSNHFVSNLRTELSMNRSKIDARTVTRAGSTYQQDTSNIGTAAHKPERPDELTDEEIARFNIPVCGF